MRRWAAALIAIVLVAAGVFVWFFTRLNPSGTFALARTDFAALPGWKGSDVVRTQAAFRRSCSAILRMPPDREMGGSGYAGTAGDWRSACVSLPKSSDRLAARTWFESAFTPFAVRTDWAREALFTGYYEPEIQASRSRHASYQTPIYGPPPDLAIADLGLFRKELAGVRIYGHVVGAHFVPFPPRGEIDATGLGGAPVLLYANDPVSVFFLHIQGSGRARLDDGSMLRLAYAGQNGRPYTPIGRVLIGKGDLDRAHMSMQAIRAWLSGHPAEARAVMESDESYVFLREAPIGDAGLGSPGTEGVPLTPEASIAVDPSLHALGVPMYVVSEIPPVGMHGRPAPFEALAIAQDTGGAIKGPARADIFWGFGPRAESIAGGMKSGGSLYVLIPKALAARIGPRFEAGQSNG
ncbi:MAG TPA: MltA domain-containing protein [Rhizomicrobium sp.]|nr:MltA domain-containing protein [Rhizomicrobium sp.]